MYIIVWIIYRNLMWHKAVKCLLLSVSRTQDYFTHNSEIINQYNQITLLTLEALWIRDVKPQLNTKDEFRSRALTIKLKSLVWSFNTLLTHLQVPSPYPDHSPKNISNILPIYMYLNTQFTQGDCKIKKNTKKWLGQQR